MMKSLMLVPLAVALLYAGGVSADNRIRVLAPISKADSTWEAIDPDLSQWVASSEMYGCTGATPATTAYVQGQSFQQTQTGCSQDFTRTRQERERSEATGAIRNKGLAVEEFKTDRGLSYAITATGTRNGMEIVYGAGSGKLSGGSFMAGIYARKGELDIGELQAIEGGRVLAYFYRNPDSSVCELRFATTGMEGWVTGGAPTTSAMIAYTAAVKKAEVYLANGSRYGTYTFGTASTSTEGGSIKRVAVPCAAVNALYANPSYFSKITFLR